MERYAPLVLRAALGAIFLAHGWPKLFGHTANVAAFFAQKGLPFPGILVVVVGAVEVVAAVAVLVGLWTRAAAVALAVVMLGAILFVKGSLGLVGGFEFDLALLASAMAIVMMGPGRWCLDRS